MEKHLLNILKEENTIIIPRLGALTITNHTTGEIMFMPYLKYDDGKLTAFIVASEGVSTEEAKAQIEKSVQGILDKIEANQTASIQGIGTFSKGDDDIEFKYNDSEVSTNENITTPLPTVNPEPIVEKDPVEEIKIEVPVQKEEEPQKEEIVTPLPVVEEKNTEIEKDLEIKTAEPTKAEIKEKQKAEKEAKELAEKEAKLKLKEEKIAKSKAEKEAKTKAKADKKNSKNIGEDGEELPKKKKGFLFWILMLVLLGLIGGGVHVAMHFDHYKEMIPFLHHDEKDGNHEEHGENEEHSDGTKEHETGSGHDSKPTEEHSKGEGHKTETKHNDHPAKSNHSNAASQSGNFYIILGTFGEKVNAEGLSERMIMEGNSNASVIERNGSFSVIYNKYSSKETALSELDQARAIAKNAWVYTAQ